jgi:large subunit ribosomal protein L10
MYLPSEKVLEQKKQVVVDLNAKVTGAMAGVLVDYKGINVEDDTKLRKDMREAGVDYAVVKNTLLRFAIKGTPYESLEGLLEGTTSLAVSADDAVAPAKVLAKYMEGKNPKVKVKAGFVDGKVIDVAGVEALAKLPSKEVLIAQVLGGLNAPISGFANVLNANLKGLVVALNAIAEKQSA